MKRFLLTLTLSLLVCIISTVAAVSVSAQGNLPLFNAMQTDPGMTLTCSSLYSSAFPLVAAYNGETVGAWYGTGDTFSNVYKSGTADTNGNTVCIAQFSRIFRVVEVVVVGAQNNPWSPSLPDDSMTSQYANVDMKVHLSGDCAGYSDQGHVQNNSKVVVHNLSDNGYLTKCAKLIFDNTKNLDGHTRIAEIGVLARQWQ